MRWMKTWRAWLAGSLLLTVGLLAGCGSTQNAPKTESTVLRYADNQVTEYPGVVAGRYFAGLVKERTHGRIVIEMYDGGQLGDERNVVDLLRFGSVDIARVGLGPLMRLAPQLQVLHMPFLFRDYDHFRHTLDGDVGQELLNSMTNDGIRGLTWYDSGARSFFNARHPVRSRADMAGLRLRVQTGPMKDFVRALGAVPVVMNYGEIYAAVRDGRLDGAENSWPSYVGTSVFENAVYFVQDEHSRLPDMQVISEHTWEKLSPEDQQILLECAQEAAEYEHELWSGRDAEARQQALEDGVQVTELSPEAMAEFQKAAEPVYAKYCAPYQDLLARIRAVP